MQAFVSKVFELYGVSRSGWSTKMIGFREVILATDAVYNLRDPEQILRWIFKINDIDAEGEIPVADLERVMRQIVGLSLQQDEGHDLEDIASKVLASFERVTFHRKTISEEEFVYDCYRNDLLCQVLNESLK